MTSLRDMLMTLKMKEAIVDESVCSFLKLTAIQIRGKIHTTWPWCCMSMWFRGSFYGIFSNGDDHWKGYQIMAWSCYVSWSLLCHCFVEIQQSFSCIFHIKDDNDFSQFCRTEVNETHARLCHQSLQKCLLNILLVTLVQIN